MGSVWLFAFLETDCARSIDPAVFEEEGFVMALVVFDAFVVVDCWSGRVCMDFCFEISRSSVFAFWEEVRRIDLAVSGRLVVRKDVTMLHCVLLTVSHCLSNVSDPSVYHREESGQLIARAGSCMYHGDAVRPRA